LEISLISLKNFTIEEARLFKRRAFLVSSVSLVVPKPFYANRFLLSCLRCVAGFVLTLLLGLAVLSLCNGYANLVVLSDFFQFGCLVELCNNHANISQDFDVRLPI